MFIGKPEMEQDRAAAAVRSMVLDQLDPAQREAVLKRDFNASSAHYFLALAYLRTQKNQQAETELSQAVNSNAYS